MRLISLSLMQDSMQRHTDKPMRNNQKEIQVHCSTKMLLPWAKPHQQSSVLPTEQKYPLQKWAVLWKTQFCCYSSFLYTQGTRLVSLVNPGLTHFLYAFDKCGCASRSSCIACPWKSTGRAHNWSQTAWPPSSLLATVITRGNVGIAGETSGWKHVQEMSTALLHPS